MKSFVSSCLLLPLIAAGSFLQQPSNVSARQENGAVVAQKAYVFPPYEKAVETTDVENYADRAAYEKAVGDANFELQKLTYLSDGLKVTAYLYKPKRTAGQKFPAVIFNRGSVVRGDIAPELVTCFRRLAAEGFVILAPLLRQSDGGEGRDEVGGADANDLTNIVAVAKSLGFVDADNLFMYGESRGGMMTYQAIRRKFPMKAAAVFGAFTSLQELVDEHPQQYTPALFKQLWPDYEARKNELFEMRSAVLWADQLNVPLLIMHGGADPAVSPVQSLNMAQRLQKAGKVYELLVYAGDNHILARNQEDRDQRAVRWFKKHLGR
ncbi:MAG TPA: prolyl oligopeptidase family serine peptidase [Pyrinomonadaceae bacterium]|nr:prolyl oligopeptidase family serine peptidase [Pyrinomonadaceae bacterium]